MSDGPARKRKLPAEIAVAIIMSLLFGAGFVVGVVTAVTQIALICG